MGEYVRNHIDMLSFIESQLDKISGVNNARQGTTEGDEKVSVNNMAWSASNSMTEPYYRLHDLFKRNLMKKILNVAKYVWKKNPKKGAYVLDDIGIEMVTMFEDISDSEYDIHVTSASDIDEIKELLKSLAQAAMQNGTMTMSQAATMYMKDSVSGMLRFLEEKEDEASQRASQAAQAEQEANVAAQAQVMELKYAEIELKYEELDRIDMNKALDRQAGIEEEAIRAMGFAKDADVNDNGVPDIAEQAKIALGRNKLVQDSYIADKKLRMDKQIKDKEFSLKEKELLFKEKELVEKAKLEREKLANDYKIAKQNKNKYDK